MAILLASVDFEYNKSKERDLNVVCGVISYENSPSEKFWLHKDDSEKARMTERLRELKEEGYKFLAYSALAEARSILSIGDLDPLDLVWYDLYLEYRCLTNHNHHWMYGKQYKKGKIITTKPPKPKWQMTSEDEEDEADKSKPDHGLGACLYKTLGVQIDNEFKTATRDLIISAPSNYYTFEKETILAYCASDTEYLIPAFFKIIEEYKRLLGNKYNPKQLSAEMAWRAEYSVRSAYMEREGYPINVKATKSFSDSVATILWKCQNDINKQFPDRPPFHRKKGTLVYSMNEKALKEEIRKWIESQKPKKIRWPKTAGGDLSISLKAIKKFFNYSHSYPRDNYFAQIVRYLNLKQNLNGFSPNSKNTIWDYVGSDGFVRPYMGIYTAQSARSQPKATSFIPLKSAWMRCMIEPPKGHAMIGIDWASQEFMLGALEFEDEAMMKTYESGDVYLGFLKDAKVVPMTATKATHGKQRDDAKPVILGLSYDMTEVGLAIDLTEKWGRPVSEVEALMWVNRHHSAYPTFWGGKELTIKNYKINKYLKLADGWYMWGDNNNFRSTGNCRIQGMASCIMRRAVQMAQDRGLIVSYTLHDAIYIICKIEDRYEAAISLAECMDAATRYYYPKHLKERATVRLEADIWSPELEKEDVDLTYMTRIGGMIMPTSITPRYIDKRGIEQYEEFKNYLYEEETELDLEF